MFFNQTNQCSTSFIKMSSQDAAEMARKTLDYVEQRREEAKSGAIERERQRINNGFFHKLFGCKDATVEEAVSNLEYDTWNFDYHFTEIIASKNEKVARQILNACKHADEILISTEELNLIS
jgi:hypothetical protein